MITQAQPEFDQVNLVVSDMDAALAFYRAMGLVFTEPAGTVWPEGTGARHAEVTMPSGVRIEFDNVEMARLWHPGRQAPDPGNPGGRAVVNFSFPARADVDRRYAELTSAGHCGRQAPYDAFWGGRYAAVADPDGNECGLMSPTDTTRRYLPTDSTDAPRSGAQP